VAIAEGSSPACPGPEGRGGDDWHTQVWVPGLWSAHLEVRQQQLQALRRACGGRRWSRCTQWAAGSRRTHGPPGAAAQRRPVNLSHGLCNLGAVHEPQAFQVLHQSLIGLHYGGRQPRHEPRAPATVCGRQGVLPRGARGEAGSTREGKGGVGGGSSGL